MYEVLFNCMQKTEADIVWCDYIEYYAKDKQRNKKHNLFTTKKFYRLNDNINRQIFAKDLFYKYHF